LVLAAVAFYGCAMWTATVVLNQHYLIDLVAGALLAIGAWRVERLLNKRHRMK
jgi:membrane-associated phospholipid phosphatase